MARVVRATGRDIVEEVWRGNGDRLETVLWEVGDGGPHEVLSVIVKTLGLCSE